MCPCCHGEKAVASATARRRTLKRGGAFSWSDAVHDGGSHVWPSRDDAGREQRSRGGKSGESLSPPAGVSAVIPRGASTLQTPAWRTKRAAAARRMQSTTSIDQKVVDGMPLSVPDLARLVEAGRALPAGAAANVSGRGPSEAACRRHRKHIPAAPVASATRVSEALWRSDGSDGEYKITLGTGLMMDRVRKLETTAAMWQGPMSVAVLANDPSAQLEVLANIVAASPELRRWADVATVNRDAKGMPACSHDGKTKKTTGSACYPFNVMRNIAVHAVSTEYVFMLDADLVPSVNRAALEAQIQRATADLVGVPSAGVAGARPLAVEDDDNDDDVVSRCARRDHRYAYVVPALTVAYFDANSVGKRPELILRDRGWLMDSADGVALTRQKVANLLARGVVQPFHLEFSPAYMPTRYDLLLDAAFDTSSTYAVDFVPQWEPFFVAKTACVPPYEQQFVGRGFDDVEHVLEMQLAGFEFVVLNTGAVVIEPAHEPPLSSPASAKCSGIPADTQAVKEWAVSLPRHEAFVDALPALYGDWPRFMLHPAEVKMKHPLQLNLKALFARARERALAALVGPAHKGCIALDDRVEHLLPHRVEAVHGETGGMSPSGCIGACRAASFALAGVDGGDTCRCGTPAQLRIEAHPRKEDTSLFEPAVDCGAAATEAECTESNTHYAWHCIWNKARGCVAIDARDAPFLSDESRCNTPCVGSHDAECGGPGWASVYAVKEGGEHGSVAPAPNRTEPTTTAPGNACMEPAPTGMEKVFVVGMFKTGTTSATTALEMMGARCARPSVGDAVDSCGFVNGVLDGHLAWLGGNVAKEVRRSPKWDTLLAVADTAEAFADGPWLFLYKEMDQRYPGSKFVLTTRNATALAVSDLAMWHREGMMDRIKAERFAGGATLDELTDEGLEAYLWPRLVSRYETHVANVRAYFRGRPCDLLEIDFATAPDPFAVLARFTGRRRPVAFAFPHSNRKEDGSVAETEERKRRAGPVLHEDEKRDFCMTWLADPIKTGETNCQWMCECNATEKGCESHSRNTECVHEWSSADPQRCQLFYKAKCLQGTSRDEQQ